MSIGEAPAREDARAAVAAQPFWYHTMELAPGVVTPGHFDLRGIVDKLPWPDVRGKRCLDVGPYDGFFSFELERRGAAEVVATDIGSPEEWDWPITARKTGPRVVAAMTGERTGGGFRVAKELLGSSAERIEVSAYDLSPERVGRFEVVVCGSLMLHLRDPVRALEAIRSVCGEWFLSCEAIDPFLTALRPRTSVARMRNGKDCQWWVPNLAGHRSLLASAGFEVVRATGPYAEPPGPGNTSWRRWSARQALSALITRGRGVPHAAALCRPAPA